MKMKAEDFERLKAAIGEDMPAGATERARWNVLHRSGFNTHPLYEYLNDENIDTALRKIAGL